MDDKLTDDQQTQLLGELRGGHKLAAVKRYKEWTGSSLVEAKHSVERLAAGETNPEEDSSSGLDEKVMDEILDAIQQGQKLNAVKIYRQSSGTTLKESKEFVEQLMSELGVEDTHQNGCAGMLMIFIVIATGSAFAVA